MTPAQLSAMAKSLERTGKNLQIKADALLDSGFLADQGLKVQQLQLLFQGLAAALAYAACAQDPAPPPRRRMVSLHSHGRR